MQTRGRDAMRPAVHIHTLYIKDSARASEYTLRVTGTLAKRYCDDVIKGRRITSSKEMRLHIVSGSLWKFRRIPIARALSLLIFD